MWLYHNKRLEYILSIHGYARHISIDEGMTISIGDRRYAFVQSITGHKHVLPGLFIYRRTRRDIEFAYFVEIIFPGQVTGLLIVDFHNLLLFFRKFMKRIRKEERASWLRRDITKEGHCGTTSPLTSVL